MICVVLLLLDEVVDQLEAESWLAFYLVGLIACRAYLHVIRPSAAAHMKDPQSYILVQKFFVCCGKFGVTKMSTHTPFLCTTIRHTAVC